MATIKTTSSVPVKLPTWTDAQSVSSYLTSLVGVALAIVTLLHPGFKESSEVQALVPTISFVVAGIAQAVNIITHRNTIKAILTKS